MIKPSRIRQSVTLASGLMAFLSTGQPLIGESKALLQMPSRSPDSTNASVPYTVHYKNGVAAFNFGEYEDAAGHFGNSRDTEPPEAEDRQTTVRGPGTFLEPYRPAFLEMQALAKVYETATDPQAGCRLIRPLLGRATTEVGEDPNDLDAIEQVRQRCP